MSKKPKKPKKPPQNKGGSAKPKKRGGNPPVEFQWKPGQSGNPGGRPRRKVLSDAYRAILEELVPGDPQGRTFAEMIAKQVVMDALKGRNKVNAASEIADRTEGKARQAFEVKNSLIDDLANIVKQARERAGMKEDEE